MIQNEILYRCGTGHINSFIIDTELFDVVEDGTQNIAVLCRCHHTETVGYMIDVVYDDGFPSINATVIKPTSSKLTLGVIAS
ncbi:hypothetical protein OUZ56_025158 [Daphnia magna]|uniref:Uncharacterized protein n=1 Tax=Daphnia magna TaxID=35525 RepID=A0ABQ9ZJN2_9CRUS|nr:hypothetical protein OUZ56_025158 [Daphnia magna]